jgi:hypothetical protein
LIPASSISASSISRTTGTSTFSRSHSPPGIGAQCLSQNSSSPHVKRESQPKALAEKIHLHVTQIRRYENGNGQPTLDVIRRQNCFLKRLTIFRRGTR